MFFASFPPTLNTLVYSISPAILAFSTRLCYTLKANIFATYLVDARTAKILLPTSRAFEAFA
jgi:hypothetical protein